MHYSELTPAERRVLGCLIEKRWTTPDQYPLSLNALRLACNQSTNRDPVTDYSEDQVRQAASRLTRYGLARLASGHTSRSIKFRHLAEEALGLDRAPLAVLGVLLLRGPQTPGELKARSERMAQVGSLDDVERILGQLAERGYAERLGRRPGQKEDRYRQLLGGDGPAAPAPGSGSDDIELADEPLAWVDSDTEGGALVSEAGYGASPAPSASDGAQLAARVAKLEAEVAALRAQLAELVD